MPIQTQIVIARLTPPAGSYFVSAKVALTGGSTYPGSFDCALGFEQPNSSFFVVDQEVFRTPTAVTTMLPLQGSLAFTVSTDIILTCYNYAQEPATASYAVLSAIQVGSITYQ